MGVVEQAVRENGTRQRELKRPKVAKGPEVEAALAVEGLGGTRRPEEVGRSEEPEPRKTEEVGETKELEPGGPEEVGGTGESESEGLEKTERMGELAPELTLLLSWSDCSQALAFAAICFSRCFFFLNHLALS